MKTPLSVVLAEARKRLNLTQQEVADAIGVSRPAIGQWESGDKEPSYSNLKKVTEYLMIDLNEAVEGGLKDSFKKKEVLAKQVWAEKSNEGASANTNISEKFDIGSSKSTVKYAPNAPTEILNAQYALPLNVPVLGVTVGGSDHDFFFNGQTVDFVRRPPGIAGARRAYATYVVGDSMYPAHAEGGLVYVNPDHPPSIGDDVIIEVIHAETTGDVTGEMAGRAYIKRLVKRTPTKIVVLQFNPPQEIEFDRAEVKLLHRVIPWNELLGI